MRRTLVLVAAGAAAVACCGVAIAAVTLPFSGDGSTINGCYTENGKLTLRTPKDPTCPKQAEPIQWNVAGPPGAPGTPGTPGADGADGVSPTVTQLAEGDASCPSGGAAITDANGSTAYVCSGADGTDGADGERFSGTFTSGAYSLRVTDDGITLSGPGVEKIVLDANGIRVESAAQLVLKGTADVSVDAAGTVTLRGASLTAQASGLARLTGSVVQVDGGNCRPAARIGDPVSGSAAGTAVTGVVAGGSPSVCVG